MAVGMVVLTAVMKLLASARAVAVRVAQATAMMKVAAPMMRVAV